MLSNYFVDIVNKEAQNNNIRLWKHKQVEQPHGTITTKILVSSMTVLMVPVQSFLEKNVSSNNGWEDNQIHYVTLRPSLLVERLYRFGMKQ